MTPTEFATIRGRIALTRPNSKFTQEELGMHMQLGGKKPGETISAWETGTNPIPGPVAVLMRYFEKYGMEET